MSVSNARQQSVAAAAPDGGAAFAAIVGDSPAMRQALHMARKVATSPLRALLITGEAGAGKELVARCIHNASQYASDPFVALNCASLPGPLLETELFGSEGRGGEARKLGVLELSGRGTVFLEDVGELPHHLQPRLLRALEEYSVARRGGLGEVAVQCRVIAANKGRLDERVTTGGFREDLLARLSVLRIDIPPLRDRGDDVQLIAERLLSDAAEHQGVPRRQLALDAAAALRAHRWPGNVRELRQVIERALVVADGTLIGAEHLMIQARHALTGTSRSAGGFGEIRIPSEGKRLRDVEKEALELTLQLTNFNQSAAARILCISRPTLARKMRAYGLGTRTA